MNKFLDDGEGMGDYRLIAAEKHIGQTPSDGHYIAFCAIGNRWLKFKDESVEAVESEALFEDEFPRTFPEDELEYAPPLQAASLLLSEASNRVNP
jgi:hypothetical protein